MIGFLKDLKAQTHRGGGGILKDLIGFLEDLKAQTHRGEEEGTMRSFTP